MERKEGLERRIRSGLKKANVDFDNSSRYPNNSNILFDQFIRYTICPVRSNGSHISPANDDQIRQKLQLKVQDE